MASFPSGWELADLLCKLFLYFGAATIAGGSLCLWKFSDGRRQTVQAHLNYLMLGSLLGFQAVLFSFFLQIGQINGAGIAGMFDWSMTSIMLDTSLGDVSFLRLAGFVSSVLISLYAMRRLQRSTKPFTQKFYRNLALAYALAFLLIASSFRLAGHVSVLVLAAQIAIVLHFAAFALWIGSLYPLLLLSGSGDLNFLQQSMKRFGDFATGILLVLVLAGLLMAWQLLASPMELISSAYGIALLLKFSLVLILLMIAGLNKLVLVPRIVQESVAGKLARSIRWEMLVATLVLLATAYLSTLVGPVSH